MHVHFTTLGTGDTLPRVGGGVIWGPSFSRRGSSRLLTLRARRASFAGPGGRASGSRIFSGSWSAEITPRLRIRRREHGPSWTLSAVLCCRVSGRRSSTRRSGKGNGRPPSSREPAADRRESPMSGSWEAKVAKSESGTLLDLLARSVENAINGTWQAARTTAAGPSKRCRRSGNLRAH